MRSGGDIENAIRAFATEVLPDKSFDEVPRSTILWVDGPAKTIRRAELLPKNLTIFTSIESDKCIAGRVTSLASVFPEHFYSAEMSVEQIAVLAAYTIWLAHKADPLLIDGLDMAIYSDSEGKVEFVDAGRILEGS